jgi:hypothetical protein
VQHFADEPVLFGLTEKTDWLEIRYVTAAKAYFHADTLESTRRKAYVVAGNVVYLDRRQGEWAHGWYYGKSVTAGSSSANSTDCRGSSPKRRTKALNRKDRNRDARGAKRYAYSLRSLRLLCALCS